MTSSACLALLQALADVGDYLLPEKTLFADVNIRVAKPITHTDFRALLAECEEKRRVISVPGEDGVKWKITDNGRARLRELL